MNKIPAGYKQTEVGVIPEEWEAPALKDVSEKIMVGIASAATHAYRKNGIVLFRNQNILAGRLDDFDILYIDTKYEETYKNKRLKGGDILTTRTGYPGITCMVPEKYEGSQSFTTLITRMRQDIAFPEYVVHYINSDHGQNFFLRSQIGGAQKNVNAGSLRMMPLPLPPFPEQKRIAQVLGDVEFLIQNLETLIAKKRDIKQAAMQALLTGKRRLPGFCGPWDTKKLGEVAYLKNGYAFKSSTYVDMGNYRIITIANVQDGYMDFTSCARLSSLPKDLQNYRVLQLDDILISMTGNVGRICKVDRIGCVLNQRVGKLVPHSMDADLFYHVLRHTQFVERMILVAKGGAQPNLSSKDILEYEVRIPNRSAEQSAIAQILSDLDRELAQLENRLGKTRNLKVGLMQQLLMGKIRLKESV